MFIFKTASTLITASASGVNLISGAQAGNVFWQVGSSANAGHPLHDPRHRDGIGVDHRHPPASPSMAASWPGPPLVTLDSNTITIPTTGPPAVGS